MTTPKDATCLYNFAKRNLYKNIVSDFKFLDWSRFNLQNNWMKEFEAEVVLKPLMLWIIKNKNSQWKRTIIEAELNHFWIFL